VYPNFDAAKQLFTDTKDAQQASQIMQGIMQARSPCLVFDREFSY